MNALLDAVAPSGTMDVIADLAYPLPTIVIAEMLGAPASERDNFKKWSDDIAALVGMEKRVLEKPEIVLGSMQEMRPPRDDRAVSARPIASLDDG